MCWAHLNDITCGVSSSIKLYVDDILIYSVINTEDNCKMLQRNLDLLQSWAHKQNMSFNSMKCKLLRSTNKQNKIFFSYSIQDTSIKEVTQAKYLGVTLNSRLIWSDHIANIAGKGSSVYGFMCRNFNNCLAKIKSALYKCMV